MSETSPNELKAEVRAYWSKQSCDTWHTGARKFTRKHFDQIEQWRYRDQPFIHASPSSRVTTADGLLEVGFVAGTDFIQWLRSGAIASGVDMTKEARANLTERVRIYDLPKPESLQVVDAERLPFADNTFDLGYSWVYCLTLPIPENLLQNWCASSGRAVKSRSCSTASGR